MFSPVAAQKLSSLMASKPQHLRRIAETTLLAAANAKKPRTMVTSADGSEPSTMKDAFSNYASYLISIIWGSSFRASYLLVTCFMNNTGIFLGNDKRERVVKASRDVTMNSKKVIFQLHRLSKDNKEEVLEKAEKDLAAVMNQHVSRIVKELQGTDFWKLRRAYSPGVQEYIEAATLCNFCKNGTLLSLDDINASLRTLSDPSIEPLQINVLDYLLGVISETFGPESKWGTYKSYISSS